MADLFLNWGALGAYGTSLADTPQSEVTATVDTGGVAVDITFDSEDEGAEAFTFNAFGFFEAGETQNPQSHLKLLGEGGDGGTATATSTTILDFRAVDTDAYSDNVQNVSFRLNDVDESAVSGDLEGGGINFEDVVTIKAYDVDGNIVPVTLTPSGTATVVNTTVDGNTESGFEDAVGSVLVEIPGPVSRIEIEYDNGGESSQAVLVSDVEFSTVDLCDENGDPIAVDDSETTALDTAVIIDVLGNDSDPDGDPLSIAAYTAPINGNVTDNGDGTMTYTPAPGFSGTDSFSYVIEDGNGGSDTGAVTVEVEVDPAPPVENQDPIAVDDAATTAVGTPVVIDNPASNDSDPDGDTLTVDSLGTPGNGSVIQNDDGTVTYTPDDGFSGVDTFDYEVSDGLGGTDTGTVTVEVDSPPDDEPTNQDPTAVDDTAATPLDTPIIIPDPSGNDTDPEGDPLTVTSIGVPTNGTAELNPDGTVTYTPDDGYQGSDTISYVVDDGFGGTDTGEIVVSVGGVVTTGTETGIIDDDIFPVAPEFQELDPLNGLDEDPDPSDNVDSVTGTSGADSIATGDDDDTINSGDGDDTVEPGIDDDLVDLGGGDDFLNDIQGADTILGGGGDDTIIAGIDTFSDYADGDPAFASGTLLNQLGFDRDPNQEDGRDSVEGGSGDDVILTGDDADTILGGSGDDTINAGIDDDSVAGGTGDDSILGGHGSDTLLGGQGNDYLDASLTGAIAEEVDATDISTDNDMDLVRGGQGDDTLIGGDDDDSLDGGQGDDSIDAGIDDDNVTGGVGDDTIIGGHGSDTLDGGQGDDFIDGSNMASLEIPDATDPDPEDDRDFINGALGDDTLYGGDDDDTLIGGSGEDFLHGGIDEDSISGGADDDTLVGGRGNDTLDGGAGQDSIRGGEDRDMIRVNSAAEGSGDTVDGGSEGDDYDILDLGGAGERDVDWRLVNQTPDSNGNGTDGTVEFLDGSGAVTGTMDFFEIEEIVCFTPGTLIATPQGERLVEDLVEGDRVITRDNGIQEIKWLGRKDLTGHDLARKPHFNPILIQQGALGNNLPEHDLLVSPNHRVLVANDKTALYFEEREVLVAAKHLTGLDGVDEVESLGVSYIHVMFEGHEVILSNGAWTESFQPGDYSLKGIGNAQRQEIFELFPELEHAEGIKAYGSARRSLKKHEAALLTK
ncbi:Ig-like domain-containing protein [Pelagimonas varians]|uniref:Bifunctional hemolysin/adenylate cyclase n=1 Tax=Pelagimonas varians TaxID=696760 RepID=A0A238K855_9RHOB|nr:Ig-like domain-containing protein [Pelagimonas varians]PYG31585.1 Ca2+-binding RTX toxin-like protein [Pelagimonas varians]SMX38985.1 Bifunctional hemolysin/adenylate cyclase precursor [Pelagimonas varians]